MQCVTTFGLLMPETSAKCNNCKVHVENTQGRYYQMYYHQPSLNELIKHPHLTLSYLKSTRCFTLIGLVIKYGDAFHYITLFSNIEH